MNKAIDDTIKEIIFSIIQFNADIENNNAAGLKKFIDNFIALLKRFKSLTNRHESEYIDFKDEFSGLFTYLFVMGEIYELAGNLITQKENEGIEGVIIAIRQNGNPLNGISKISPGGNLFNEFVLKYQGLYFKDSLPDPEGLNPIIERGRLALIYWTYKTYIDEPDNAWIKRFCPNEAPVNPLKLDPKAKEGSNKLVMLAILASIQDNRKESFNYNDFVLDRFGIMNFDKARHDHKYKPEFTKIFEECNTILKE